MKRNLLPQLYHLMKYSFLIIIIQTLSFNFLMADITKAQRVKSIRDVTISLESFQDKLSKVFREIESKTNYKFAYNEKDIEKNRDVRVSHRTASVYEILYDIARQTELDFKQVNRTINVSRSKIKNKGAVQIKASVDPIRIQGVVKDETGEPLTGVTVRIKETNTGAITDVNGKYAIEAEEDAVLVFSFVGYETQEVSVGGRSTIDIVLAADLTQLNEIVVVGYGTQEKKEITSAVTSVSAEDFNKGNVNNVAQLLQGKVAGLNIARPGGDPNAGFTLRLRGLSTFGANSSPLIVIDGVIGASLNSLDPNDIATMDVLKDGSAAAIYGSRGSSGVILITTKRGAVGKTEVDYNGYVSAEQMARTPEVMTAAEFIAAGGKDQGSETDWFDELTRTAISHVHNISVSGGNNTTTYRASINYRNVEGVAYNSGFNQLNGRLNLTQRAINDRLALTVNLSSLTNEAKLGFTEAFRYATIYNPTAPVFGGPEAQRFDGYWQTIQFDYFNPVSIVEQNQRDRTTKRLLTQFEADFELINGLNVMGRYALQTSSRLDGTYFDRNSYFGGYNRNGEASRTTEDVSSELFETTATYRKALGEVDLSGLVGYSYQEFENEGFSVGGFDFISDVFGYNNLSAAQSFQEGLSTPGSWKEGSKLIAGFARINLNYQNTYFFSASIRREGSTRFGENNRWGSFPAVSAGVDLANLVGSSDLIDNLKVRASYGITGNIPGQNFLSQLRFAPSSNFFFEGNFVPSYSPVSNDNPDLKWERKKEFDIGVDFTLARGRIDGTIDYYIRDTDQGLFELPVPVPPNLFDLKWLNIGKMRNQGLEVSLGYKVIDRNKLTYDLRLNFASYENELVSLSNDELAFGTDGRQDISNLGSPGQNRPLIRVEEGKDIGQIIALQFDGLNDDGTWRFIDQNNDAVIDDLDEIVVGNGLPDFDIGFNNTITYGNFDLNAFFRGTFGHDLIHTNRAFYENTDVIEAWNAIKTRHFLPNLTDIPLYSDFHVENASFFKLDNLTLGYNLDVKNLGELKKLRFYFTGQNLFVITDYTGVDPEVRYEDNGNVLAPGIDRRNTWFATRTYTLGLNASF